jgi:glycosyltransferase involved in cell wall biosynthesis
MAHRPNALAVDGKAVSSPDRNAALWYAQDGYDPAKGLNGRRVAGESFLKGFLRHADVAEFALLAKNRDELRPVADLVQSLRPSVPLRHVPMVRPSGVAPIGTVYFPSPNFSVEAWRRAPYGQAAFAICGITHTTSTIAVMQGLFDLRMAPVREWDAVICTSKSVQTSVLYQQELIDGHIRAHLRAEPPARPMFPVIPLGIHCDDFTPDPAAGQALRAKIGAGPKDVVFTTIARLTPHEKFDPLPIYRAMQAAQGALPGQRLHVVFCGVFRDQYSRRIFETGAVKMMPDVGFTLLDGAKPEDRKSALSGADVFMFLIDNIQETFGLAPIEGMAAGLPILASDWDGMKDTITPDVGFRVTTRSLSPQHLAGEALRHHGGIDSYHQYCAATSAVTEIDQPELVARILELARNPDLRARMGAAGRLRARQIYDWQAVIPQMQDLWAEQNVRRRAGEATALRYPAHALAVAPSPTGLFASYPTARLNMRDERLVAVEAPGPQSGPLTLAETFTLRDYAGLKRSFASLTEVEKTYAALLAAGEDGAVAEDLLAPSGLNRLTVDRVLVWLLKYGFARRQG